MMELVKYNEEFRDFSYVWLQDDELCKLVDSSKPTKASQAAWFKSLPFRNDYLVWGIKYEDIPIGVCGIKHLSTSDGEFFGFLGEKQYWGKGLGKKMMSLVEERARSLGLISLYLHVLEDNTRAIALYKKCGYQFDHLDSKGLILIKNL